MILQEVTLLTATVFHHEHTSIFAISRSVRPSLSAVQPAESMPHNITNQDVKKKEKNSASIPEAATPNPYLT
jgi:hypothetical protein